MAHKNQAPLEEYGEKYFQSYNYADRPLGRFSMYAFARRFYAGLVRFYTKEITTGRLLEMGCGLGHLLALLENDFDTYGFDIAHYAAVSSKLNSPESMLLMASADQQDLFKQEVFTAVIALHLVEHLQDPQAAIRDVKRMLIPGGIFLFATPNPSYRMRKYKLESDKPDAIDKDPTHINVHKPETWVKWVVESGFEVIKTGGDGLWDVPYLPVVPRQIQFVLFGLPSLVQVLMKRIIIPVNNGVNLIVVARKPA